MWPPVCARARVRVGRVCVSGRAWVASFTSMYFPTRVVKTRVSVFKAMASPKRVFAMITAALTFLTFARVVVCLVEAYVAVRSERMHDEGLMQLCNDPTSEAAAAPDLRALCLRKRAERAAPIVLKAVLRAVTTAFSEFCEVFSSPSRVALLVMFSITGIAAPIAKALAALFVQNLKKRRLKQTVKYATSDSEDSDEEEEGDGHYQVVEISPRHAYNTRQRLGLTLRRGMQRIVSPQMMTNAI